MRNLKFLIALLCVVAGGCSMVVDDTGRTPEVAHATQTVRALEAPDFPSIEIDLFPDYIPTVTETPTLEEMPTVTPTLEPCYDIKGNINAQGEHIYHMKGQANYTRVIPEAWFCTEEEAVEAGFRKSQR